MIFISRCPFPETFQVISDIGMLISAGNVLTFGKYVSIIYKLILSKLKKVFIRLLIHDSKLYLLHTGFYLAFFLIC